MIYERDLQFVLNEQKEIILLGRIASLLGWDQQVNLPSEAFHERAEQISLIETQIHNKMTSKKLISKTKKLILNKKVNVNQKFILKKLLKESLKRKRIPNSFVKELSKTSSLAHSFWEEAKEKKDFGIFKPHLEKIVKLKRLECKFINLPGHPYNSLLDDFEECMTVEKLKEEFSILKEGLIKLIKEIKKTEKYKKQKRKLASKKFDYEKNMDLIQDVIKRIGLLPTFSRTDFSVHPFTTKLGENDIRVTTAIRDKPLFAFEAAIHEAGHGLYESNLPKSYLNTLLGEAASYGLHESQSRIWENNIGLSKPFWKFYYKEFNKRFNLKGTFSEWYEELNQIETSPTRLDSDEIEYCLHIILRFEIELDLIGGKIEVKDLPEIWNKKIKEYFGIKVKDDGEGVLQDTHWSSGYFGYFPTYAIGTIYATQLYSQMKKEIKNFENNIEKGNFKEISKWLEEKIHKKGSTKSVEKIIEGACGEGLNSKVFLDYLVEKYSEIYGFDKQKLL